MTSPDLDVQRCVIKVQAGTLLDLDLLSKVLDHLEEGIIEIRTLDPVVRQHTPSNDTPPVLPKGANAPLGPPSPPDTYHCPSCMATVKPWVEHCEGCGDRFWNGDILVLEGREPDPEPQPYTPQRETPRESLRHFGQPRRAADQWFRLSEGRRRG